LRQALEDWKVLFFRDQHLDHAEHVEFALEWGALVYPNSFDEHQPPPGYPAEHLDTWRKFPEFTRVDHKLAKARQSNYTVSTKGAGISANTLRGAHVDSSPLINPPSLSLLRAETVPVSGGDTTWFDAVAAYEGLSKPVRRLADTLWAEHRLVRHAYAEGEVATTWVTQHPLVRVIPETGQRALFLSPGAISHVVGVSAEESDWILDFLFSELTRPGYTVRFKWQAGDLAISDNRATAHLGPVDLSPDDDRVLHLLLVDGELPLATDGRRSVSIAGEPKRRSTRSSGRIPSEQ
jgi:taurine dioxygenase